MVDQALQQNPVEQWMKVWPKMVARAWSDDSFLARLTKDTEKVAAEYGLPVLPSTQMLSIPPKPTDLEDIEDLGKLSEHKICGHSCCF